MDTCYIFAVNAFFIVCFFGLTFGYILEYYLPLYRRKRITPKVLLVFLLLLLFRSSAFMEPEVDRHGKLLQ